MKHEIEFPPATALLRQTLRQMGVAESEVAKVRVMLDTTPVRQALVGIASPWASTSCAPAETGFDLPPRDPFDPERPWRRSRRDRGAEFDAWEWT